MFAKEHVAQALFLSSTGIVLRTSHSHIGYLSNMTKLKLYYIHSLPLVLVTIIFSVLWGNVAYCVAFLIGYVFPLFLMHPDIKEYREKSNGGLGFVNVVYSAYDFADEWSRDKKFHELFSRHFPSACFYGIYFLITWSSIVELVLYIVGMFSFEFMFRLYKKSDQTI